MSEDENQQPSVADGQGLNPHEERTNAGSAHQSSNLRRRWRRKTVAPSGATIREDDAQAPKEIKAVTIEHAERLNFAKERQRAMESYAHRPNRNQKGDACGNRAACKCHSNAQHASAEPMGHSKRGCCGKQQDVSCMCRSFWSKTKLFVRDLLAFPSKNSKKCCNQQQPLPDGQGEQRVPRPHRHHRRRRRASEK